MGTFQDGGVLQNNPTLVALAEFAILHGDEEPDLVLNLGSGSQPALPLDDQRPRFLRDGWLARLFRASMALMQGQKTWNDIVSLVSKSRASNNHYRLDVTLQREVSLDDITAIPAIRSMVHNDRVLSKTVNEVAHRMFATLFYFVLDILPVKLGGKFAIQGQILCLRKAGDPALPRLLDRLKSSKFLVNGSPIRAGTILDNDQNITHNLTLTTGSSIRIELKESSAKRSFAISGTPCTVSNLVSRGGLTAAFGTRTLKRSAAQDICTRPSRRRRTCRVCISSMSR